MSEQYNIDRVWEIIEKVGECRALSFGSKMTRPTSGAASIAIVSLCVQRLDPPCFNRLKNNSGRDDVELIAFADFTHPYNDKEVGIRDSIRNYRLILWGAKLHIFTGRTCFDTYLEKSILLDRKQIEVGYIPDASMDVSCDPAATQKLTFDSSFAKGSDERFSHAATCTEA
jgi:hypothetical protein